MGGHRNIEYGFWANEQTFGSATCFSPGINHAEVKSGRFNTDVSSFGPISASERVRHSDSLASYVVRSGILVIGGLLGAVPYKAFNLEFIQFEYWWAGVYSMAVGLLLMLIEYPRGRRLKGSVLERKHQQGPAKFVTALGPLTRNYFSRFIIYFLLSIPACLLITTFLGGVGLAIGSLIYLTSAIKGEQWCSPMREMPQRNANKYIAEAPQNPPPRRPVEQSKDQPDQAGTAEAKPAPAEAKPATAEV